jgi:hypothetical protein
MRTLWLGFGTVLLILTGCRSSAPDLKPKDQPECYFTPSPNDKQYDRPFQYSKESDDPSLGPSHKIGAGMGPGGGGGPRGSRAGMGGPGGY